MSTSTLLYWTLCAASLIPWALKNETAFRASSIFFAICWTLYFYFSGILDAAALALAVSARQTAGLVLRDKSISLKNTASVVFILIFISAFVLSYQSYWSVLPLVASIHSTLCQMYLKGLNLRVVQPLISSSCWCLHAFVHEAYPKLAAEFLSASINYFTVWRIIKTKNSI